MKNSTVSLNNVVFRRMNYAVYGIGGDNIFSEVNMGVENFVKMFNMISYKNWFPGDLFNLNLF